MNDQAMKSENRWKKFIASSVALLLTLATVALLFVTFSEGGWWIVATLAWLPPYYIICDKLGYPATDSSSGEGPFFID
jgi:hypothetical protein